MILTSKKTPRSTRLLLGAAALALTVSVSPIAITAASAQPAPASFADLAQKSLPAVVNIYTTQTVNVERPRLPQGLEDFFNQRRNPDQDGDEGEEGDDGDSGDSGDNGRTQTQRARSLGSGFIISADGFVVTNNHVIDKADEISVRISDDEEFKAEVVGRDPETDIALLKIKADKPLPYVDFGDSEKIRVGDWVMAIGNPYGLGGTVTAGIVSARGRIVAGPYDDLLQTDTAINPGNSGGPMFDMDGRVIGVNSMIVSPYRGNVGIGFAIPSNQVAKVIEQLKSGGKVSRGWMGATIQSLSKDAAEAMGLPSDKGALISNVVPGDPADLAGLKPGDVVKKWDGQDVDDNNHMVRLVGATPVGKTVNVEVIRSVNGKLATRVLKLTTKERKQLDATGQPVKEKGKLPDKPGNALGLEITPLTEGLRNRFKIEEEVNGLLIVRPKEGTAIEVGLRPGDVILSVNNVTVTTLDALTKIVDAAKAAGKDKVFLQVYRAGPGNNRFFVPLPIDPKK